MKKQFAFILVAVCALVSFAGTVFADENVLATSMPKPSNQEVTAPKIDLFVGKRGADVKTLQEFLFGKGFLDKDSRTGYFGNKTKSALVKYQKANRIPGVGRFGPATRAKMIEHLKENTAIGGQRDEHGCLGPAGYTWDESLKACVRPWEKPTSMMEKSWAIKTIDGKAYTGLTFMVKDGSISAKACNTMFGKVTVDDKEMTVKAPVLASTMMACDSNLMEQDTILNQTVANGAKITFDFNANPVTMTLVGGNHTLVFVQK